MSSIIDKITTVANWLTSLVPNLDSLVQLYDADFDSVELCYEISTSLVGAIEKTHLITAIDCYKYLKTSMLYPDAFWVWHKDSVEYIIKNKQLTT